MPEATLTASERALLREVLSDPGLARFLAIFRTRWESYGRITGRATVETREEALAISGIIGKWYAVGRSVSAADFDTALQHGTRFACTLKEALEIHFDEPMTSKADREEAKSSAWEESRLALHGALTSANLDPDAKAQLGEWLRLDQKEIRRRHLLDQMRLLADFDQLIRVLEHLPARDEVIALAVLATRALGDPHGLDVGAPLASFFDRALAGLHPQVYDPLSRGAEGRDDLLTAAAVAKDRTSPKVDAFGLQSTHPDYAHLTRHPTATFSLRAVESMRGGHLRAADDMAFVVENPSVFDRMVERFEASHPDTRPTIICTNGRFNLADRVLLTELVRGGACLRYSGDFDSSGLSMASDVLTRYGAAAELWRMSPADYTMALSKASPLLDTGEPREYPLIPHDLIYAMRDAGKIGYQEALLDQLISDVLGRHTRWPFPALVDTETQN